MASFLLAVIPIDDTIRGFFFSAPFSLFPYLMLPIPSSSGFLTPILCFSIFLLSFIRGGFFWRSLQDCFIHYWVGFLLGCVGSGGQVQAS